MITVWYIIEGMRYVHLADALQYAEEKYLKILSTDLNPDGNYYLVTRPLTVKDVTIKKEIYESGIVHHEAPKKGTDPVGPAQREEIKNIPVHRGRTIPFYGSRQRGRSAYVERKRAEKRKEK